MRYPVNYVGVTNKFSKSHKGIDLGWNSKFGGKNQPIYAVEDGVVIYNRKQTTGGYVIHIRHDNGYVSEYGHLLKDSQLVREGHKVKKGQQIASMGSSGMSFGNHLHFGLYKGTSINYKDKSKFVDPMKYLCLFSDQTTNDKTRQMGIYQTKIVAGVPSEPLVVRNKYNHRIKSMDLYNGDEVETFEDFNKQKVYVDNIQMYTTYKKYLK